MSRRSDRRRDINGNKSEHADAMVRLECPHGHTVGYLARLPSGPIMLLDDHRAGRAVKAIQPFRLRCWPCFHNTGMRMDLRLSQARAEALLADVLADPTHREHVHVLGG